MPEPDIQKLEDIANTLRQDVIEMVVGAGSGHVAGPLDMADIFAAMYFHI
ncbi:transketolase, partial [Candidatus Azambacteria bacterium]|nr:transketolase [Candidatus Azambacteria bacterium]